MLKRFNKFSDKQKTLFALGVFALLIAAFYGNTLFNDFAHDDIGQVVQNEYVHSVRYLPKVITGCIWESALGDCTTYYRPVQSLSYLLTYQITPNPWLFHLVNLLYFFAAVSLTYLVARALTRNNLFSFLAALIFLIHPINNEVVNWISAVPELTALIFILLAVLFYLKYRAGSRPQSRRSRRASAWKGFGNVSKIVKNIRRLRFGALGKNIAQHKTLLLASLFYFFAMLAKEPAVLVPLIFFLIDVSFFKVRPRHLLSVPQLRRYIPFGVFFILYMIMRLSVLGGFGRGGDYYGTFTLGERIHAFFTLFGQYALKLVAPYPLLFFYPFEKQTHFFSLPFVVGLIIAAVFFAALLWFAIRRRGFFALSLVWVFVFLAPVLLSLNAVGENIFSERYLFASSVGFALLVSSGLMYLFGHKNNLVRKGALVLVLVLVGLSWAIVFPHNQIWKNDFTLYGKTIEQNPSAYAIRRNLAVELTDEGKYEEALGHLEEIIERDPDWRDLGKVYNNIGEIYARRGDPDVALEYYRKIFEVSPGSVQTAKALNNIGAVYLEQGEALTSLPYFCQARHVDPNAPQPRFNMERVVSLLNVIPGSNLHLLYNDVITEGVFEREEREGIRFSRRLCDEDSCTFEFTSRFAPGEIILPFLIMASISPDLALKPPNPSFDPSTGIIALSISREYQGAVVTFIFPTCDGRYYEVTASPENNEQN